MKIFLIGATGYIGNAVAELLRAKSHAVLGLARSREAAERLKSRGITPVQGTVADLALLTDTARQSDGVIYAAATYTPDEPAVARAAVEAILKGLEGSGKPFIYTSGIWVHGPSGERIATEDSPLNPLALVAWRPAVEQIVLSAAARGVRSIVIRPAVVYGRGAGMVADLAKQAREKGVVKVVGDGTSRWPLVHADDLADLYVRALEKAPAGSVYLAASGPSVNVRAMAELAAKASKARVELWPLDEARKKLGPFADALAVDQQVSAARAKRELGWAPKGPDVFAELEKP